MIVAIIPARGGSKRIPRKNIRVFAGKPIIAYSIAAAHDCGLFDRVIVSTDDDEIASIARAWGGETPFIRPSELSDDHTGTTAVTAHALAWLADQEQGATLACCIYATAPFITPDDLRRGYELLTSKDSAYVFSATTFEFPIQRAFMSLPGGGVAPFCPKWIGSRSQDLEPAYHDAGQFYWGRIDAFLNGLPLFGANADPLILPRHRVRDIDTLDDWAEAELMYAAFASGTASSKST